MINIRNAKLLAGGQAVKFLFHSTRSSTSNCSKPDICNKSNNNNNISNKNLLSATKSSSLLSLNRLVGNCCVSNHSSQFRAPSFHLNSRVLQNIDCSNGKQSPCKNFIYSSKTVFKKIGKNSHTFKTFIRPRSHFVHEFKNMAKIISGKEVADEIKAKLKVKVASLPVKPKLSIVQVGGREDSNVYIRMKIQFAESIGALAEHIKLGRDISEDELAQRVQQLNQDESVHGIITQLPFDSISKIDSDKIVNLIDPKKDVDGLCVYNAGKLLHGELNCSSFIPCTPNGCIELIKKSGINLEGTRSVVIGRSKIVGSPMAQLLVWHNSTVTICHSRTKNLDQICREADVLVAAVGKANLVKKTWLKPGAVVIDCGINVIPDATKKSGTRLVGDVDFDGCKEVASAITPVPGGVGPMTVAMLIYNTVEAASRSTSK